VPGGVQSDFNGSTYKVRTLLRDSFLYVHNFTGVLVQKKRGGRKGGVGRRTGGPD